MAWTQSDCDALKAIIGTGVLTVQYDGPPKRLITYQSTDQMRKALADMQAEVNATAGTRKTYRLAAVKKGV